MRADAPVYVIALKADNTVKWIDPSFINMVRETGIVVDKKEVLAHTRVGIDCDVTVNGEECYIRRYDLQTGDRDFFVEKAVEETA
jgi:hypothetical protein